MQDFEHFLAAATATLQPASYAFSKVFLICEGNPSFKAQLLCGMPRVHAVAASLGLVVQCDVTAEAAATQAAVHAVVSAHLNDWSQRRPWRHYPMGDPASAKEAFFSGFPSINPHSAAVLAHCGLPLRQILGLSALPQGKVPSLLGLVPMRSLELFLQCAEYGATFQSAMGPHRGTEDVQRHGAAEGAPGNQADAGYVRAQGEEAADAQRSEYDLQIERAMVHMAAPFHQAGTQKETLQHYSRQHQPSHSAYGAHPTGAAAPPALVQGAAVPQAWQHDACDDIPDLPDLEEFLADNMDADGASEATSLPGWRGPPLGGQCARNAPPQQGQHTQDVPYQQRYESMQHGYTQPQVYMQPLTAIDGQGRGFAARVPGRERLLHAAQPDGGYAGGVDEFGMPLDPDAFLTVNGDEEDEALDGEEVAMSTPLGRAAPRYFDGTGPGQMAPFSMQQQQQQHQGYGQQGRYADYQRNNQHIPPPFGHHGGPFFPGAQGRVPGAGGGPYAQVVQQPQRSAHTSQELLHHRTYGGIQAADHSGFGHPPQALIAPGPMEQHRQAGGQVPSWQAPQLNNSVQASQQSAWQAPVAQPGGFMAAALRQRAQLAPPPSVTWATPQKGQYLRRKWGAGGGGRGGASGRDKGRKTPGGKFTSRTSRQW